MYTTYRAINTPIAAPALTLIVQSTAAFFDIALSNIDEHSHIEFPTVCHRTFGGTNHSPPAQTLASTMRTDAKARSTEPAGSRRAEIESLPTTCALDRAATLKSVLPLSITCIIEDTSALEPS
jgi:hypothetical protein